MATALEGELVRVVKTLEELQHRYLGLLEAEAEAGAEEAEAALRDYRLLTDKMLEWIVQCDNVTRMNTLLQRSLVRCSETSHASLLLPALRVMARVTALATSRDAAAHSSQMFRRLAVSLCKKIMISADAIRRSNSESTFYTRNEAKEILEKCSTVLNYICQHKSNVTRFIIEQFQEFKPSLRFYVEKYRNADSRNLFEAVESEEECMKESGRKTEAALLIQATFRMHRQRSRWRRLKLGFVALQRLARRRRRRRDAAANLQREEVTFQQQLERVKGRQAEMERRFKAISRLHPNKINNYLDMEREMAARRLQAWWRRRRGPELAPAEDPEAAEAERRHRAAVVLQTAARRWLLARLRSPAWSQLLAHPRGISEERARALRREIEVWQAKNAVFCTEAELGSLHRAAQTKFNRFVAGLPARRLAEHRTNLARAQIRSNMQIIEEAPGLSEYSPSDWSRYHALPLDVASQARLQHTTQLERLGWPGWKRRIHDIVCGDTAAAACSCSNINYA